MVKQFFKTNRAVATMSLVLIYAVNIGSLEEVVPSFEAVADRVAGAAVSMMVPSSP